MRFALVVSLLLAVLLGPVWAQQQPEDTRTKESYKLDLTYVETLFKQCRTNLANIVDQATEIERQRAMLAEELKVLTAPKQEIKDEAKSE